MLQKVEVCGQFPNNHITWRVHCKNGLKSFVSNVVLKRCWLAKMFAKSKFQAPAHKFQFLRNNDSIEMVLFNYIFMRTRYEIVLYCFFFTDNGPFFTRLCNVYGVLGKVKIFWEGQKELEKISHIVLTLLNNFKKRWEIFSKNFDLLKIS